MSFILKDGSEVLDKRLDLLYEHDERNTQYPVAGLLQAGQKRPKDRKWRVATALDQGTEGACVGMAITHDLLAEPLKVKTPHEYDVSWAKELYWEAQKLDQWPGGSYPGADPFYEGTSILAGMKAIHKKGYITEYRWANTEPELANGVSHLGPAIIGVSWYEGMADPGPGNFIKPTGEITGGHAVLVSGISYDGDYYIIWNSWGKSWGKNGRGYLKRAHMKKLLSEEHGQAVIPIKRHASV